MNSRIRSALLLGFSAAIAACGSAGVTSPRAATMAEFEEGLQTLQASSHVPGISAAIARDQQITWTRGFGKADIASGRAADDTTAYHLASLTKPFAATILLQLVQEGRISLDDPVSSYGIQLPGGAAIRIRHLMSHTSGGVPGSAFSYDGDRFGLLDSVISRGTGQSFAVALNERILSRLPMRHTAPNPQSPFFAVRGLPLAAYQANFARGYSWTGSAHTLTQYPDYFGTAAGLVSSARDMAEFSMAMDRNEFLTPATTALAYAPTVALDGSALPYGLGWFATDYKGVRVIWHYGLWTSISSLIIKIPSRNVTFVLLGNSDALSAPYPLGAGRLDTSPWARLFLDTFIVPGAPVPLP